MFFWNSLVSLWFSGCWQFDLCLLCLFWIQLEHLEVLGSRTVEACLGEFWALLCLHVRCMQLCGSLLEWKLTFSSPVAAAEFSKFPGILSAVSSFRSWSTSAGIPSPPLALFIVMLSEAHLTSHSRMSGSRWVITVRNVSGRKSHPCGPLIRAFYWAVAPGQNSRGRVSKEVKGVCEAKGVCEVWGVGKGFIAPAGLPYKEENAGSGVIGVQGLRVSSWLDGLDVGPPLGLVCGSLPGHVPTCPGMPRHASTRPTLHWPFSFQFGLLRIKVTINNCVWIFVWLCLHFSMQRSWDELLQND